MSAESAKEFFKRVLTDQAFANQLLEQKATEQRQKFAADAGYVFTEDELQQLLPKGITIQNLKDLEGTSELPDEMMEAITGGKSEDDWEEFGIQLGVGSATYVAGTLIWAAVSTSTAAAAAAAI